MGCCPSSDASMPIEHRDKSILIKSNVSGLDKKKLTVHGDYIDNDTRTIMMLLTIAGNIPHDFQQVDRLKKEKNEKVAFEQINPASTIPVIVDRHFKILGSTKIFVNYLVNTYPKVKDFCPDSINVTQHLNWFAAILRPCCKQLIETRIARIAKNEMVIT